MTTTSVKPIAPSARPGDTAEPHDRYPTRTGDRPAVLERTDPVVVGGPDDGPFDGRELDHIETCLLYTSPSPRD